MLWLAATLAASALMGCSDDAPPGEMRVAVQRAIPGQTCWASLTADAPDAALGLDPPCAAPTDLAPRLAGGSDLIRLVIDYGADLEFTPGTTPPAPTITMTLDGVITATGGSVVPASSGKSRAIFLATFQAPPRAVTEMRFDVQAAQGFSHRVPESFRVDAPQVGLTVDQCKEGQPCELTGGIGTATTTVTVPGATAVDVTLSSTLDDVLQPLSVVVRANIPGGTVGSPVMTGHAFPAVPLAGNASSTWQLFGQWNSSTGAGPRITLNAPVPAIRVQQCASDVPCALAGGVGNAAVELVVPSSAATSATLTWAIDNVLQPGSQSVPLATLMVAPTGPVAMGTTFVPVPVVHGGAAWQLFAQYAGTTSSAPVVTILAPTLGAALACGSTCVPKVGGKVGLLITAPAGFVTPTALVSTSVDGVPSVVSASVTLTTLDVNAGTISGVMSLPVPSSAGSTWQIDTIVGAYKAPAILTTIVP
jgi:hypothetical protein